MLALDYEYREKNGWLLNGFNIEVACSCKGRGASVRVGAYVGLDRHSFHAIVHELECNRQDGILRTILTRENSNLPPR